LYTETTLERIMCSCAPVLDTLGRGSDWTGLWVEREESQLEDARTARDQSTPAPWRSPGEPAAAASRRTCASSSRHRTPARFCRATDTPVPSAGPL
jgi:hypothetical protein